MIDLIPASAIEGITTPVKALEIREKIRGFEEIISLHPNATFGDSPDCPLKHTFCDGIYVREIRIPAGTVLTGKIHRHAHPNFLVSGEVTVVTEGGGVERLKGPMWMISPAGTKRALQAHTDLIWVTVHRTDKTDLKQIEEEIIAPDYAQIEQEVVCLG